MIPEGKRRKRDNKKDLTLLMKSKRGGCPVKRSKGCSGILGRTVEDEELRLGGPLEAFISFGQNVLVRREPICNVVQLGQVVHGGE